MKSPERIFLSTPCKDLNYFESDQLIQNVTVALTKQRIGVNSRVALLSNNTLKTVLLSFAFARSGAVLVPLNTRLTKSDWKRQIELLKIDKVIATDSYQLEDIDNLRLNDLFNKTERRSGELDNTQLSEHDCVAIFTSGTEGPFKAVFHNSANLLTHARLSNSATGFVAENTWVLALPLYHIGGIAVPWRVAAAGGTVTLPEILSSEGLLSSLSGKKRQVLSLVPTQLKRLLEIPKGKSILNESIDFILLGGSAVAAEIREEATKLSCRVFTSYGMSELCSHVTLEELAYTNTTSGKPLPEVSIIVEDKSNEIKIKSPTLTTKVVTEDGEILYESDSWFATGDSGKVLEDGSLNIFGRKNRMFISGGENIFHSEIEQAACSFSKIEDAAVVSVPDKEWGERAVLFVEAKQSVQIDEIEAHLQSELPGFKLPVSIQVLDSFPRTGTGKIDFQDLDKMILPGIL